MQAMVVGVSLIGMPSLAPSGFLCGVAGMLVLGAVYWAAERYWLGPRRVAGKLLAQGLCGTAYRFPFGDLPENARRSEVALARPMPLCHDIAPRVVPFLHDIVEKHVNQFMMFIGLSYLRAYNTELNVGNVCITWFRTMPRVVVAEPELVRDILSDKFGHFKKFSAERVGKLLALGLASYDGEKWETHRRILNPAFHLEKLKRMLPAFSTCCSEMIGRWDSKLAGCDGPCELDIWQEFRNLTGDVISRAAFGSSFMEGRRIFQLQDEQIERVMKDIQYIQMPGYLYLPTENNRRMKENNREIKELLRGIIEKRNRTIENSEFISDDVLGLMLKANMDSGEPSNLRMSMEDVMEECKLFYMAGMDTTAVLLTWTLVALSMHPEWQDRAREEVLSVFGRNKPNFDGLGRLKTASITMILHEVLRLYPPSITMHRRTSKDMQIGGITLPAGIGIEVPIVLIHHNTYVWGEDAHEFKPERFADGISKATKVDQAAFFPFGWGPRICIGQNFALLEAKMALCSILQNFEFRLSPSYIHAPQPVVAVTLHPQYGAITLSAGIGIEVSIIQIHHNTYVWGENVHEFKPERLADGISKVAKDDQTLFFPFGWGPRICIGQNFALLEAKMALCSILQNFEFRLLPSYIQLSMRLRLDYDHLRCMADPVAAGGFSVFYECAQAELSHAGVGAVSSMPWSILAYGLLGLVVRWQAGLLLHWLWLRPRPRRLELALRAQGLRGTSYRFLVGYLREHRRLKREACARPLPLRYHDIAPRVVPFFYNTVRAHGKTCVSWFGPTPRVTIVDPDLAKDVMSNKSGHFEKPKFEGLTKLLNDGLPNHEGEKWKILNPAFHLEKLKPMLPAFSVCCEELACRWMEPLGSDDSYELDIWPEMQSLTGDVTWIIYEVLRLYPSVVTFLRQTYKQMEIGGITYPAGVTIELPVLLIHHDSDIWGSDVHEFKPERFANGISKASKDPAMVLGAEGLMGQTSVPWSLLAYGLLGLLLLWQAGRLLHSLWWQPQRLELALRAQGIRGTPYRFLTGDLKEHGRMTREAWARPLPLRCHDIAPRVAPFLHNTVRQHGKTCVSWFGPVPKVTIADPEVAKDVLSNKFGHFEKLKFQSLTKLFADGLASHEGERWVKHRRILNPAFHLEKLKRMLPAFSACCEELVSRWMEHLGSDDSYELDVWPEMQSLTGDVISRTAFGSNYLEGRRIFQLIEEQVERIIKSIKKTIIPGYMFFPTKNNRRMHQIKKEIDSILRGLIDKRMQAMEKDETTKEDLLGMLLESNMRHTAENGQPSQGLTIEEVIEECKLFYFAGMETTSVLLTWTMLLLSMHPEWQDRAREEILGLFGKNRPEYECLSRLKIVMMILYEVLRLYPPAVTLIRQTYKQMEIGGITYPAGVIIELPVLLIHHDSDIWGSDVHEFKPERFAEGISKASKDTGAFLPFGWGPRICLGQNFALLEAKMALCMILQSFKLELAPAYTHAPEEIATLRPVHGAQIKLRAV
uniref:Cytochrome P450 n=1 Tax=Leersia perrieri TaxID=77586 RepID=A0A0D9V362_9ORYZ